MAKVFPSAPPVPVRSLDAASVFCGDAVLSVVLLLLLQPARIPEIAAVHRIA